MSNVTAINTKASTNSIITRSIMANARYLNGVPHAEVPVEAIIIDDAYQRTASGMASRIAREWDNFKAGNITLSLRDGHFHCVDGQNRVIAARTRGQDTINAIIYTGLTEQDEAKLFAQQMNNVKLLTSYDKLNAGVVAGDKVSIDVWDAIHDFNIKLVRQSSSRTGYFSAITAAVDAVRLNGKEALVWVLRVIEESGWHDAKSAYSTKVFRSLMNMYGKYNEDALVKVLKKTSPNLLTAQASVIFPDRGAISATSAYIETLMKIK